MKQRHAIIPLDYRADADHYFRCLAPLGKRIWLDSGCTLSAPYGGDCSATHDGSEMGNTDIISAQPLKILINPHHHDIEETVHALKDEALIDEAKALGLPFSDGAVGYFNYEYAHQSFGIALTKRGLRPSVFGFFTWSVVVDHQKKIARLIFSCHCPDEQRLLIQQLLTQATSEAKKFALTPMVADVDAARYATDIATIKEYILAGDCYQINYSQRFRATFNGDAASAYLALRKVLPGPFSAYLELTDDVVLSFSPERFIKISEGRAITQPIKGTIARGKTPASDRQLAEQLLSSEKNRAENVMIVDLLRNDFSKSCKPFSVKVTELCALKSFANVHHLVSTIEGELDDDVSPLTFFMRCFPGGSITGAPKKRAMEIIDELEDFPRNIYCGCVCYYSTHGEFDSNIAIRSILVSEGNVSCWGGGGIVNDSSVEEEYLESLQKISVLITAINQNAVQDAE